MLETAIESHHGQPLRVARLGQGEAVVLLHGYPENLQVFAQLAPGLAVDKQVIAFDWPGMGHSADWPGGATPLLMAKRLLQLLDEWQIDKAHLIGQDMGGQPALVFAAVYPTRVRSVVVMNSLVSGDTETSWEITWLRRFGVNKVLLRHFPRLIFWRALHTFLPRRAPLAPALYQDMWRTFRVPAVRQFIVRMCAGYEGQLPRLPAWYRQVACPVLVLWGGRDKHFPVAHAHYLKTQIPQAQLAILPQATHWMVLAQAEEVLARIRTFYAGL
ncbi:alpha/beta fold hydrolase [Hymenobacter arizonensis]|uniref:Pimeloyl-ACP methyl ester carboxylesterase n=1 Tax=Hymenobacter arizonensis TaxID=1227077 RepID=A0A1I5XJD6_HYMAR|nr:alpha/beta hydrolase [Hymenobacter arizonensis]SFQ31906.1 Pimeloyl-ACP methyl ester carboxylesterase [Hymenobacter arizonensis]